MTRKRHSADTTTRGINAIHKEGLVLNNSGKRKRSPTLMVKWRMMKLPAVRQNMAHPIFRDSI
jgi:hypothetical protein